MKRKRITALAIVLCFALVLTGCGGESKPYDYDLSKYVEIGQYKGLEVTEFDSDVSEGELRLEIKNRVEAAGWYEELTETFTEGAIELWDIADVDFIGRKGGIAFEGGTGNADLLIGSGQFVPGFEDGLLGENIGDTVMVELTFPEEYYEELAGQDVEFEVTINSVAKLLLSIEFVETESDYRSIKEYEDSVMAELVEAKKAYAVSKRQDDLLSQIFGNSIVLDYPKKELNNLISEYKKSEQSYARSLDKTWKDYLEQDRQMTQQEYDNYVESYIKAQMDFEMILRAIARKEGFEIPSEEEYAESKMRYLAEIGYTSEEELMMDTGGLTLEEAVGKDIIELYHMYIRVLELAEESAVVV